MKLRFIFLVLLENQLQVRAKNKYHKSIIVKYLKMKLICFQRCNIVLYFKLNTVEQFYGQLY